MGKRKVSDKLEIGLYFTIFFEILVFCTIVLSGCGQGQEKAVEQKIGSQEPLNVVATIFPYYDFTRQIAGDMVDLELIVPAGMDSHSFEPTPADMRKIEEADVIICNAEGR